MNVQHTSDGKKGVFFIEENGKRMAEMTYVFAGDTKFIIEHTGVNPGHEGKGLGKILVNAAADYARQHALKILPLCTYAKKVMEENEQYKDVLF